VQLFEAGDENQRGDCVAPFPSNIHDLRMAVKREFDPYLNKFALDQFVVKLTIDVGGRHELPLHERTNNVFPF